MLDKWLIHISLAGLDMGTGMGLGKGRMVRKVRTDHRDHRDHKGPGIGKAHKARMDHTGKGIDTDRKARMDHKARMARTEDTVQGTDRTAHRDHMDIRN